MIRGPPRSTQSRSSAASDVYKRQGEQAKEQIFWHEVVHGLVHYRNVDLKNADEETIVEEIAIGLYGIMKANGLLPGQKAGDAL